MRDWLLLCLAVWAVSASATAADDAAKVDPGLVLRPAYVLGNPAFRHADSITHIEPLADGRRALSTARDGSVRLWNLADGKELRRYVQQGDTDVWNVKLLPGDRQFLSCGGTGSVYRWDLETGARLAEYDCDGGDVLRLAVVPGGKQFVSCESGNKATLWDIASGEKIRQFKGHRESIYSAAVAPDGKILVTGSEDGTVRGWELATGKSLWVIKKVEVEEEEGEAEEIPFDIEPFEVPAAPDPFGADVPLDPPIIDPLLGAKPPPPPLPREVDKKDDKEEKDLGPGHAEDVYTVCFFPDGKHVASCSGDSSISVWDAATGEYLWGTSLEDTVTVISPSPDGKLLAATCDDNHVYILARPDGEVLHKLKVPADHHWTVSWSIDGKQIYSAGHLLHRWDADTGEQLFPPPDNSHVKDEIEMLAVSPDGGRVYAASEDNHVYVWDTKTRERLAAWKQPADIVGLEVFPDGKRLLVIAEEDYARPRIVDATTGKLIREIKTELDTSAWTIAERGKLIVLASDWEGHFAAFDVANGKRRYTFPPRNEDGESPDDLDYNDVIASVDGERIYAIGSGFIDVHRARDGEHIRRISQQQGEDSYETGALLADGRALLAFGNQDDLPRMHVFAPHIEEAGEPLSAAAIDRLITQLDADEFSAREKATVQLIRGGEAVLPKLAKVEARDSEVKWRLARVKTGIAEGNLPTRPLEVVKLDKEVQHSDVHPTQPLWAMSDSYDVHAVVRLGRLADGQVSIGKPISDGHSPVCLAFSPDGRWLYAGNRIGTVSVYEVQTKP